MCVDVGFDECVHIFISVCVCLCVCGGGCFPYGSVVKNLPATKELQEMWVRSLGQEDPLEEGMATHSSIRAWRIPMDKGAWRATV